MTGTSDHDRIWTRTSAPSWSGKPRSRMIKSGNLCAADSRPSAAFSACRTTNLACSKPAVRKRRRAGSSSMIRTVGPSSLIDALRELGNDIACRREIDRSRRSKPLSLACDVKGAAICDDEGIGDPEAEASAGRGGTMLLAANALPERQRFFGRLQSRTIVTHREYDASILGSGNDPDCRALRRVLC